MTNELIKNMLNDIHNKFFCKWRDRVPERDSPVWDQIYAEAMQLYLKYNSPQGRFLVMWLFNELMDRRGTEGLRDGSQWQAAEPEPYKADKIRMDGDGK